MKDYLHHSGRIGASVVNAEGAKLILDALRGKKKRTITGHYKKKESFEVVLTENYNGDEYGTTEGVRYKPKGDVSYSFEVIFQNPVFDDRSDFSVAMSVMKRGENVTGATIIKVRDPGNIRSPYGMIIGTDREKAKDIFDIKNGGNSEFAGKLVNFCLAVCRHDLKKNPPSPVRL